MAERVLVNGARHRAEMAAAKAGRRGGVAEAPTAMDNGMLT